VDPVIGLTLGRIFGTEVRAHWTWVPIIAFIAVIFGMDLTDGSAASWPTALAWSASIATAILVFVSVTGHELSHVYVARRNGQQNPTVMVQLLGGPYIMEVKPKNAGEEMRIALAGPVFSLVAALAFGVVGSILVFGPFDAAPDGLQAVGFVTTMTAAFNAFLCVINLVPGYPMDGARVLHALVWRRTGNEATATAAAIRVGRNVGVGLIVIGALLMTFVDLVAGLSLVVAGWLVMSSSRFLDRRSVLQELIAGLRVRDAEDADVTRIPPQLTLDVFAAAFMGERLGGAALVEHGDELVGIIGTAQIRRIPSRAWTQTRTEDAMVKIDVVPSVTGDTDLWSALELLERTGLDALIVTPDAVAAPDVAEPTDVAETAGAAGPADASDPTDAPERAVTTLMTRRSAAKLVHEKAEDRHRQIIALGLIKKSRFRGR
jgi:Zn-dependent protease